MEFKCYDIAESVIDEATARFHGMKVSERLKNQFKDTCEKLDKAIEAIDAESFSVEVNEYTTEITLTIGCNEFEIDDKEHPIYAVVSMCTSYTIKPSEDIEDGIDLLFVVPGIWCQA